MTSPRTDHYRLIGMLTHTALDHLWYCSPDAFPADSEDAPIGCCPRCCAPCEAIAALLAAGDLDDWVRGWPDMLAGTQWWDEPASRVDRDWLARAWPENSRCCADCDYPGAPL